MKEVLHDIIIDLRVSMVNKDWVLVKTCISRLYELQQDIIKEGGDNGSIEKKK